MDNIKITILMPIYNGIEFISESIHSIKSQTYKNWDLLIGINGHPKNSETYKIANSYSSDKIKVFDFPDIKGKSNTLNEMLKYVENSWIALLDVDDKWLPHKLEEQIKYTMNYDVVGTLCQYFGKSNTKPILPIENLENFNFLDYNPIINSSSIIKKELCYWDNKFDGVEDYDMWLRLWYTGKKFYNVNKILVFHRVHNKSAFNSKGNHLKVNELLIKYKEKLIN